MHVSTAVNVIDALRSFYELHPRVSYTSSEREFSINEPGLVYQPVGYFEQNQVRFR